MSIADPTDRPFVVGGLALISVFLVVFSVLLGVAALDVWSGIIVFLVLASLSVPVLRWVARKEQDPWLFKVMYSALIVKLLSSLVRYFFIFFMYDGNGDAAVYHQAGITFARRFAEGIPIHPLPVISAFPVQSHWIADITGVFYIVTGPSAYAGFFLFSFLCFWGQILIVRAFRAAVPEGDYRRLAVLVLFLPSLLFWPSSIGKEALMIGCIGLVTYGAGLLLAPKPRVSGVAYFVMGLIALSFVRPHIAFMSVGALMFAVAVGVLTHRGEGDDLGSGSVRGRAVRVVALFALILVASFASTQMNDRFGGEDGASQGTSATLEETRDQTSVGGSEFVPVSITGPAQIPLGLPSVLFRPLPWEARNMNGLIAGAEGLILLGLFVVSWRRVASFPKLAMKRPFLVFVAAYVLVFGVAFSFVGNFGILARQRTQMMPMVLVLLALPPLSRHEVGRRRRTDAGVAEEEAGDHRATVKAAMEMPVVGRGVGGWQSSKQ